MAKIMLVEDDKSLREIYSIRLVAEGYDIVSAGDGEEALGLAVQEKPDLIISDVMMPKISGFDMLDILRSTPETSKIKVIMMTALSGDDQRIRSEQLGADKHLVKSQVGIEDVINAVHEVLGDVPNANATANINTLNATATPEGQAAAQLTPLNTSPIVMQAPAAPAAPAPMEAPVAPAPAMPAEPTPAPVPPMAPQMPEAPAAPAPMEAPVAPAPAMPAEPTPAPVPPMAPQMPEAPQMPNGPESINFNQAPATMPVAPVSASLPQPVAGATFSNPATPMSAPSVVATAPVAPSTLAPLPAPVPVPAPVLPMPPVQLQAPAQVVAAPSLPTPVAPVANQQAPVLPVPVVPTQAPLTPQQVLAMQGQAYPARQQVSIAPTMPVPTLPLPNAVAPTVNRGVTIAPRQPEIQTVANKVAGGERRIEPIHDTRMDDMREQMTQEVLRMLDGAPEAPGAIVNTMTKAPTPAPMPQPEQQATPAPQVVPTPAPQPVQQTAPTPAPQPVQQAAPVPQVAPAPAIQPAQQTQQVVPVPVSAPAPVAPQPVQQAAPADTRTVSEVAASANVSAERPAEKPPRRSKKDTEPEVITPIQPGYITSLEDDLASEMTNDNGNQNLMAMRMAMDLKDDDITMQAQKIAATQPKTPEPVQAEVNTTEANGANSDGSMELNFDTSASPNELGF